MRYIDLRSDTVTEPTREMRLAMLDAPVGDDVFQDDPTMNKLEALIAKMLGKDDAVFVPSGVFSNQLALFTHCNQGDEVILDQNAHIVIHESGASSIIAGVQLFTLDSEKGIWDLQRLARTIKERTVSTTRTRLIVMENPINGKVLPLDYMKSVYDLAKSRGLRVHLDGARIFNAACKLQCDASEFANYADSVSVCLSKGLASPVGTLLVGDREFIAEARSKRKVMGGGMRQVGVLAACGLISLEVMTKRLHIDHENAEYMASLLREIPGIRIDESERDINMVFFDINDDRKFKLHEYLFEHGVKILPYEGVFRFVTHKDVNREDIESAIALVERFFQ